MSDGSQHALYTKDTDGTDWYQQRHTGCTLSLTKTVIKSAEIIPQRQTSSFRYGTIEAVGDVLTELSFSGIDRLLSSAFMNDWGKSPDDLNRDMLSIGSIRNPLDMTRVLGAIGGSGDTTVIFSFHRVEVSTMSLSATPGETIKVTFSCLGRDSDASENQSYIPEPTTAVDTSQSMVGFEGNVLLDGDVLSIVTEIQLNIDNSLQSRYVIKDRYSLTPSVGTAVVTGQMTVYFKDIRIYNKFHNEDSLTLALEFKDELNNEMQLVMNNVKITSAQIDVNNDGPILLPCAFEAVYNTADDNVLRLMKV